MAQKEKEIVLGMFEEGIGKRVGVDKGEEKPVKRREGKGAILCHLVIRHSLPSVVVKMGGKTKKKAANRGGTGTVRLEIPEGERWWGTLEQG